METFHPRLRADVVVTRGADGSPSELDDPVTARRIALGGAISVLVGLMDGRSLDQIAAAMPRQVSRPQVEGLVRRLLLLGLLDGACTATVDTLRRFRGGALRLEVSTLPGARFACQGSGACCQAARLGPLTDADVARLEGLDLAAAFPALPPGPLFVEHTRDDGSSARYLRQIDHRCQFLQGDMLCGVHAVFGAAAKPDFCRRYPLDQVATIRGLRVFDRGSCSSFAVSARTGLPLADQLPAAETDELYHPVVEVPPGLLFNHGIFLDFTDAAIALSDAGLAGAPETLRAVGRLLGTLTSALASCPLTPGQPDAALAEVLGGDPRRWFDPTPPAEVVSEGRELFALLVAELGKVLGHALLHTNLGPRRVADMRALIDVLRARDPRLAALPLAPAVDEVLHLSLRQNLFGAHALVQRRPFPALLRAAFIMAAAVWGGRAAARARGASLVEPADLSAGHALAARLLDVTEELLVQAEPMSAPVLEALPAILAG